MFLTYLSFKDEAISEIPMDTVGTLWEWEVLLYSSVGMRKSTGIAWWEWKGMKTLHIPIYHPEQGNKPT